MNMAKINDILNIARGEIGYKESSNNSNKYGAAYGLNNQPWCVIFLWWVFMTANASALFYGGRRVARCSTLYNHHKGIGQAVSSGSLRPGDIVFFDFSGRKTDTDHVGIVESVNGSTITTIEGNTSSGSGGSQSNGDSVYRRQRNVKYISAAYRPAYDDVSTVTKKIIGYGTDSFIRDLQRVIGAEVDGIVGPETKGKLPLLKENLNQRHPAVSVLQVRLFALGYSVGDAGADGIYGTDTKAAVIELQTNHGLTADGECGPDTWAVTYKA